MKKKIYIIYIYIYVYIYINCKNGPPLGIKTGTRQTQIKTNGCFFLGGGIPIPSVSQSSLPGGGKESKCF